MIANRFSMRTSLILAILATGAVAALLTYVSASVYCDLAFDAQRDTFSERLRTDLARAREDFDEMARILAERAEQSPVTVKRAGALTAELDELHRYFIHHLRGPALSALSAHDPKTSLLAVSPLNHPMLAQLPCHVQMVRAGTLARTSSRICIADDKPYFVAVLPHGTQPGAHLYFVSALAPAFSRMERDLGAPLRLSDVDGNLLYQSVTWPRADTAASVVIAGTPFSALGASRALQFEAARDMSDFVARLHNLRYLILLGVLAVMLLVMLFALTILERASILPLRLLTEQLRRVLHDKRNLGERVEVRGNKEVVELAGGFNEMTGRLRELYETLERMAFTDALTGLPNRSMFRDHLQQAILAARRDAKPFALLMLDLDRFKDINDTLGHHTGDALLVQVAQRLRGKLRTSDILARMGGDEFAILLPNVDVKHTGMAARMLLQSLRAPFSVEEQNLSVGASVGIVFYPENGVEANVLMQRADVAMYSAKESGSGYTFYNPSIDQNFPMRLTMLSDLREALEQEQFELFYQPIVNLERSRVTGVEALVRWRHPVNGMLLPDSFIPLLEQSGLIRSLMPWVLNEALTRVHALQAAGFPLTVSVNLSMHDLQDTHIVEGFAEQLEAREVDPRLLVIEITESAVMTDAPRTLELLTRLAGMGLRIAVDDFGTGYSSLAYLKKLPVQLLKIDKSFIVGMTTNDNDATIVRTSIELAHNLGMEVIAEGVESEAALQRLRALGCNMVQGHYIGRPLTASELDEWLLQSAWGFKGIAIKPNATSPRLLS